MITLTLGSFNTCQIQPGLHASLMKQLAKGMAALKSSLTVLGAWDRKLVMMFSGFGRRPRQNSSNGTDHGTAAPHFVAGCGTLRFPIVFPLEFFNFQKGEFPSCVLQN